MKPFKITVIINEDFDNPHTIHNLEANDDEHATDLAIDLMFEQGGYDRECDTVDVINVEPCTLFSED